MAITFKNSKLFPWVEDEGIVPDVFNFWDWKIPGKKSSYYPSGEASLKEIYSPAGLEKGGAFVHKAITTRLGGWWTGITGRSGKTPDTGGGDDPNIFERFRGYEDALAAFLAKQAADLERAKGKVGDIIPDAPLDLSKIIDTSGLGEGLGEGLTGLGGNIKEGMDNFSTALAMGLAAMGAGFGGGLGGGIGEGITGVIPSFTTEEGGLTPLAMGGLALGAYVILKKVK